MKEQYDAKLKERDIQSSEKDTALRKAASEIQIKRNREYEDEYKQKKEEYIKEKNIYIKKVREKIGLRTLR